MREVLTENGRRGGQRMPIVRPVGWLTLVSSLCVVTLVLLLHDTPSVSAQIGTPPSSSISSSSGPVSWTFAPVGGGTVVHFGIKDICPTGFFDDPHLTLGLPEPPATFYPTMNAKLTWNYTWNRTLPTDLDVFSI